MTNKDTSVPGDAIGRRLGKLRKKRDLRVLLIFLMVTALIIFLLLGVVFGGTVVVGDSMNPKLEDGDFTVFYRLTHSYQTGDIVIFRHGDSLMVKRVVAVAGEVVDIDPGTGEITVAGITQSGTYPESNGVEYPVVVRANCVFVMGDNRANSTDSRSTSIGLVEYGDILGRVIADFRILHQ